MAPSHKLLRIREGLDDGVITAYAVAGTLVTIERMDTSACKDNRSLPWRWRHANGIWGGGRFETRREALEDVLRR